MSDEPVRKLMSTLQVTEGMLAEAYLPALRDHLDRAMFLDAFWTDSRPRFGPPAPRRWEIELDALDMPEETRERVRDLIDRVEYEARDW